MSPEPSLLARLLKEWANNKWPDLFVKIDHSVSARYKEWVQLSIDNEWTVIDILYESKTVSYRILPCYMDPEENTEDIWKEEVLQPADPKYFEKLDVLVESSLKITYQSIENEKRLKNGPIQAS